MAIWKKAMDYLGLGPDDAYDDYDVAPEPDPRPARAARGQRDVEMVPRGRQAEYEPEVSVRAVPARPSFPTHNEPVGRRPVPAGDDSSVHPRPINPPRPAPPARGSVAPVNSDPHTIRPRRFDSAQEIADKFKEGLPVIMNLEGSERDVSRRLIDFASGLCYGLDGSMEKVATGVYLLKPASSGRRGDDLG